MQRSYRKGGVLPAFSPIRLIEMESRSRIVVSWMKQKLVTTQSRNRKGRLFRVHKVVWNNFSNRRWICKPEPDGIKEIFQSAKCYKPAH